MDQVGLPRLLVKQMMVFYNIFGCYGLGHGGHLAYLKVHLATLTIGDATFVQDLQQNHSHVLVCFLELVQKNDSYTSQSTNFRMYNIVREKSYHMVYA